MAQRVVGHAWPEEHDASCGFKAAMVPGRNVARGLDPEHCSRCTDLVRLLNEAQEARLDRWGRLLTEQAQARPGESPAAFSSRVLGGRDV